jgi:hypothetical protein
MAPSLLGRFMKADFVKFNEDLKNRAESWDASGISL